MKTKLFLMVIASLLLMACPCGDKQDEAMATALQLTHFDNSGDQMEEVTTGAVSPTSYVLSLFLDAAIVHKLPHVSLIPKAYANCVPDAIIANIDSISIINMFDFGDHTPAGTNIAHRFFLFDENMAFHDGFYNHKFRPGKNYFYMRPAIFIQGEELLIGENQFVVQLFLNSGEVLSDTTSTINLSI